jgi:hypothetical protein
VHELHAIQSIALVPEDCSVGVAAGNEQGSVHIVAVDYSFVPRLPVEPEVGGR